MPSWVVRSEGLLVNWLKDSNLFFLGTLEFVGPACAVLSEFGDQARVEGLPDLLNDLGHLLCAEHRAINIDVGGLGVDVWLESEHDHVFAG